LHRAWLIAAGRRDRGLRSRLMASDVLVPQSPACGRTPRLLRRPGRHNPAGAGPRSPADCLLRAKVACGCARTAPMKALQSTESRRLLRNPLRGQACNILSIDPCSPSAMALRDGRPQAPLAPVLPARFWRPVRHTDQVRRPTARIQRLRNQHIRCPLPLLVVGLRMSAPVTALVTASAVLSLDQFFQLWS
jgi:hypothetical protein